MPIDFKNLSYQVRSQKILKEINLDIADGDAICLYGRTGSGKSTLGLVSAQLIPVEATRDELRWFPGQSFYLKGTMTADKFKAPTHSVHIPSNPLNMLIFPSVYDELESITSDSVAIINALDIVELPAHVLNQELTQLSGGMLQRLALARVVLRRPCLAVADETYEWLDPKGRQVFEAVLGRVMNDNGIVLAFQSTASSTINGFGKSGIADGRICEFSAEKPRWSAIRKRRVPGAVILEVEGIRKHFKSANETVPVLSGVSLAARDGEWIGIFGPNGAGKSVLSRIISGLEECDTGKVIINGQLASLQNRRRLSGYVFQLPS